MKTTEEIEAKIVELRQIGSPSALSKAAELSWALGIEDTAAEEADMLTDALLGSVAEVEDPWDKLPDFVQDHITYAFDEAYAQIKRLLKAAEVRGLTEDEQEEMDELRSLLRDKTADYRRNLRKKKETVRAKSDSESLSDVIAEEEEVYEGDYIKIPDVETDIRKATLISSKTKRGKHRPLLDLDLKAVVIPSSTKGNGHLYIDKELTWKQYQKLLNVLADLEIIEPGYRGASLARGYTALRLPWVKKTAEEMEESMKKRATEPKQAVPFP